MMEFRVPKYGATGSWLGLLATKLKNPLFPQVHNGNGLRISDKDVRKICKQRERTHNREESDSEQEDPGCLRSTQTL